jgi:tetratricopeptide (TPR) repeat protein
MKGNGMKNRKALLFFLLMIGLTGLFSCSSIKHSTTTPGILTEKQKREASDLFTRAISLKETGHLQQADSLLKRVLAMNPNDAAANYEEAQLLAASGNEKQALSMAGHSVQLDSTNIWYRVLFAKLSKANGNYQDYVNNYKKLASIQPQNEDFVQELAMAYTFTGDYAQALKAYLKLENLVGVQEFLSQKIAALHLRLGEKEKALNEYKKLVKVHPDEERSYALLAAFASKNDFPQVAEEAYYKIIELNPTDPYVHISLADFYRKAGKKELAFEELKHGFTNPKLDAKTKINLLLNYYSGNLSESERKQALQLAEIIVGAHPHEQAAQSFYASMLFQNKSYKEAREMLRKLVVNYPDQYPGREQLLFCDLYLEDYQNLIKDADECLDRFPKQPVPYLLGGVGYFQLKNYTEARIRLEKGKQLTANNSALLEQFYSTLGDTYYELKMKDEAYHAYEEVLQINPGNTVVLNNYAYYLSLDKKQLDKAARMAKKAVDADPYNQNNLDTYAWVLYQQKKYEEALSWAEKALNNGGKSSGVVVEHYGDMLYRLGKKKEAMLQWKKASKLKDHSDLLDKKIKNGKIIE